MQSQALIDELMKIHPKGFDLSLERVTRLLEKLGNPHKRIPPAIHFAGTNGKGSTIAFCRAILEAAGYSVHVHTSPHLVNWTERYRLGKRDRTGQLVDDATLADALSRVADANDGQPITVFEILSAVMFVLFSEHKADFSLIEVGLGGRFDATNVIEEPLISVIAPVSLDHVAYLGDTLEKIAFEKAGIIKRYRPVAIGVQEEEALDSILKVAERSFSQTLIAGYGYECLEQAGRMVYQDEQGLLDLPLPAMIGDHQLDNAGLAIAAIRHAGIDVRHDDYATAMRKAHWAGRMEPLPEGKLTARFNDTSRLWVDGGHNASAGEVIGQHLKQVTARSGLGVTLICAMLTTKDPSGYFQPFADVVDQVLTVPITSSEAGFCPEELAEHAKNAGLDAKAFDCVDAAIDFANSNAKKPQIVLFCGSLYHVGHVLDLNATPPV